jgi:hypothetical protein
MLDVSDDSSPYRALIANHMLTSAATMYTGPAMIPPGRSRTGRKGIRSVQESSSIETRTKPNMSAKGAVARVRSNSSRCVVIVHQDSLAFVLKTGTNRGFPISAFCLVLSSSANSFTLSFASTEPRLTPACSLSVDWHCYPGGAERRPPYGQSCRLARCRFSEAKISYDCISSR